MTFAVHRQVKRKNHYEVWISTFDDNGALVHGNMILPVGPVRLNDKQLDLCIAEKLKQVEAVEDQLKEDVPQEIEIDGHLYIHTGR